MDLRLTRDEKRLLRQAGLVPSDLATMTADALMAATEEEIGAERAAVLTGRAELLALGVHAGALSEVGVRSSSDLIGRTADELLVELMDTTSRTNPAYHDMFSQAVHVANANPPDPSLRNVKAWTAKRMASGADPLMVFWRHRHGDATLPTPTRERLRLPTIGVTAPISRADLDASGNLVTPIDKKSVVANASGALRLVLGHWMWNGGHGPFVRLEDLQSGDAVRAGDEWFAVTKVEMLPSPPGEQPDLHVADDGAWVVLATPPHYRTGIIGRPENLPPVERDRLQVVVHAEPCQPSDANADPRPLRRIGGAY